MNYDSKKYEIIKEYFWIKKEVKMDVQFKRDMYHNYLVIYDEGKKPSDYYEKVLKYNEIAGHLAIEYRMIDNQKYAYYIINGLQSLECVYEKHLLQYSELRQIFKEIIQAINLGKEFLLKETDYILSENLIFFELPQYQVKLCYFPEYAKSLRMQLHDLFEYFMNKVDYNDQMAVLLIYRLYMKIKDEDCTINQLLEILLEKINLNQESRIDTINNQETKQPLMNDTYNNQQQTQQTRNEVHNYQQQNHSKQAKQQSKNVILKTQERKEDIRHENNKNQIPFVAQRMEEEQEVMYYPLSCYVILALSTIVAICTLVFCYKKKILYYTVKPSVDPVKLIILLVMLIAIVLYMYTKVFDKKHKVSKMIAKIDYITPQVDTNVLFKQNHRLEDPMLEGSMVEKPELTEPIKYMHKIEKAVIHDSDIENAVSKNASREWEARSIVYPSIMEEERTILLSNFSPQCQVTLLPVEKEKYEIIIIQEFPFFVGKLKTHMDVNIPSAIISRFHAKIIKENEEYYIIDLNSTNGTFVNGDRVESEEKRKIESGDLIMFANITYLITIQEYGLHN